MTFRRHNTTLLAALLALLGSAATATAQNVPWDVFQDFQSDSVCDLINASNGELVVLTDTGQLVLVTGDDVILEDTFVDLEGFVSFEGQPAGLIDFATDGDGFRTLWWLTLNGRAVGVDEFTGEPFASDRFPADFVDVPCDACPFWDDPTVCGLPPDDDDGLPTINLCGISIPVTASLTMIGLLAMRFTRRRPSFRGESSAPVGPNG